ncbi:cytochrome b561 / ferric reductase transmembrane domain-containing protein [Tieghemostelium lacteum]|uniref:Cytochrome b561 / ferric reductase transmembrane domain-containing protein n=1 Tax=Tieghemostelium lacteum TaxID=361077 RepID=A0A151Z2Q2_TIELA|nr:cytochrome b561 / ferric reductase transmembrane domain-containing protein [Tieghemostelium lacteum]|eukprot:KYQ88228.1 cytochrome b561 / ferric reductase transmembrane domain-containing protein [Tieghemostelium lacteum]
MYINKVLILSVIITILSLFNHCDAGLNAGIVVDPTTNFIVQWEILNDTIVFAASANVNSWLGIGWHCPTCSSDSPMQHADFAVATFNGSQVTVTDMTSSPGKGPPPIPDITVPGGKDNIISYGGYQTENFSYFIFSKLLNTGDTAADNIIDLNNPNLYFIWAHGTSNTFAKHGAGNAGFLNVNLQASSSSQDSSGGPQPPDYVSWHASLMFLAFGVLMPFGIFAGRFLKGYDWWFPLHYILQGTAFLCALSGLGLIIAFVDGFDFSTIHSIFGIITLSSILLAVGVGITSHLMWKPNRTKTPIFPDVVHHWGGRIVYFMGFATIITGMVLHQIPTASIIVFSGFTALLIGIFIFIEIYKRKYPQKYDDEIHRLINN